MDLTKCYPRSVHEKCQGVVHLGRVIDKGKAAVHGKLGEYEYNSTIDRFLFTFLGIDADALLGVIREAKTDHEIESFVKRFTAKKSAEELGRWNDRLLSFKPSDGEPLEYFMHVRNQVAPHRIDVTTWADLFDLEEGRPVPLRSV